MAEQGGGASERVSIRQSAKFHKKYGSTTTNHMKTKSSDSYVKHTVSQTDTLQGIALKYGVNMEQIRRANKIWTNDSLFLRCTLDIPVAKTSFDTICWEETNGSSSDGTGNVPPSSSSSRRDSSRATPGQVNVNGPGLQQLQRRNSAPDASTLHPENSPDATIADILIRIDSSIALTRSQVERREKLQEFTSDDSLYNQRRTTQHHLHHQLRLRQSLTRNLSSDLDDLDSMATTVQPAGSMSTQGRKVKSSLQRLQREQDEMFEL